MEQYELKVNICRQSCTAYYDEDDNSEKLREYAEGVSYHLIGTCYIDDNEESISISLIKERKEFIRNWMGFENEYKADLGDSIVFDEQPFFKEATAKNIAGIGEFRSDKDIEDRHPLDEVRYYFGLVVSNQMFQTIGRFADLAIAHGKGTLECTLEIPSRFTIPNKDFPVLRKLPIEVMFPITSFYFNYDSGEPSN